MAKDTRKISGAIRHNDLVYTPGMEDELEAAASPQEIVSMMDRELIEGFLVKQKTEKPLSKTDLGKMNKDSLLAKAQELGIEVEDGATNEKIIEMILAKK